MPTTADISEQLVLSARSGDADDGGHFRTAGSLRPQRRCRRRWTFQNSWFSPPAAEMPTTADISEQLVLSARSGDTDDGGHFQNSWFSPPAAEMPRRRTFQN